MTLYELLTGQLPFQTSDPLELIHCHIAQLPIAPHQVNDEIPVIVIEHCAQTDGEKCGGPLSECDRVKA